MLELYYSPGACSLAAHILLEELKVPYQLKKVNLSSHKIDNQDFYQINSQGLVPTLKLEDGDILTQNAVILTYLSDLDRQHPLLPAPNTKERLKALEWLGFINSDLHKAFSPYFRPDSYVSSDAGKAELNQKTPERISKLFDQVERRLQDKNFVLGDNFSAIDAYLLVMYRWANYIKLPVKSWPKYTALIERILARPSVQKALREEGLLK